MAQRSHVPKFGNWDGEENVPYTAYFDKARKGRPGTKMINPNDPEQNSDLVLDDSSSDQLPPSKSKPSVDSEDPSGKGLVRSTNESQKSPEDGDPKHFVDSPARQASDSTPRHGAGSADNRRRPSRQSTGSEYSIERSPLHRQARAPGRDSPSWEGKNSYDNSHGTPGRSRLGPANRGDETPDKGAAVPKFGEWDVSNPASADGYTHIFNKVREERQGGAGNAPGTPNERPYVMRSQPTDDKAKIKGGKNSVVNDHEVCVALVNIQGSLSLREDIVKSHLYPSLEEKTAISMPSSRKWLSESKNTIIRAKYAQ